MHTGRRGGSPAGGDQVALLPGIAPLSPFRDMRLQDPHGQTIRLWTDVNRFEFLTHLFTNGQYSQTQAVSFTGPEVRIQFEVEDIAGAIITAAVYRRDEPLDEIATVTLTGTGAGLTESDVLNTTQIFAPAVGGFIDVQMDLDEALPVDQVKIVFTHSGTATRIGNVRIVADIDGALRHGMNADMTMWSTALVANGLTGGGATAYDISSVSTFHDLWVFIIHFDEQITDATRHTFMTAVSGPFNSSEGRELQARGILCPISSHRVVLKWPPVAFEPQSNELYDLVEIVVEQSINGAAFVEVDRVDVFAEGWVSEPLPRAVYRYRIRGVDDAGNLGVFDDLGSFSPLIWIDVEDNANLFSDVAGTVQVLDDQEEIAAIDDKGSVGAQLIQSTLADRPLYVKKGINHGAGIQVAPDQYIEDNTPAGWPSTSFSFFTNFLLRSVPLSSPIDDVQTTQYTKIFGLEGFFDLIATEFTDDFFDGIENFRDHNTGHALIARVFTGSGTFTAVVPFALHDVTSVTVTLDGTPGTLTITANGFQAEVSVTAAGLATTTVLLWGEPTNGRSVDGLVGDLFMVSGVPANLNDIEDMLRDKATCASGFILPEIIEPPDDIRINFAGLMGTVDADPSPSASVTGYNLYHNSGTEEFPDFSVPAATSITPSFTFPMVEGTWRIVIRATTGTEEDGNFDNRLDIRVHEVTVGLLTLADAPPNPLAHFEANLEPAGMVSFSGFYRSWNEESLGTQVKVWIFQQDTPVDTSGPPNHTLFIPGHQQGNDLVLPLLGPTVGPFVEVQHKVVAKVQAIDGQYALSDTVLTFTPIIVLPKRMFGLKGQANC